MSKPTVGRVFRILATLALAGLSLTAGHAKPRKRRPAHAAKAKPKPLPKPTAGPILNAQALAPFMKALEDLDTAGTGRVVRVLQFGDSHTAADYWSGRVRQRLQVRFGDAGPGLIMPGRPWRGYPHAGVHLAAAGTSHSLRLPDCDGWVGLAGARFEPAEGETVHIQAPFRTFRVHLLAPAAGNLLADVAPPAGDVPVPPTHLELAPAASDPLKEDLLLQTYEGASAVEGLGDLTLTLPAGGRLLGVELRSGSSGVQYDELGLNGAELTDLERWNPALRKLLLTQAQPDLVVLAYGTNDMGMAPSGREDYRTRIVTLLRALREESGAPVLVVGPLDRLGRKRRQRASLKDGAAWEIQTLTAACKEAGCAFWDARKAMGGYGSVAKWRRSGLAQKDLVHLTGPGYQKLGDLMADALLAGFRPGRAQTSR